MKLRCMVVDDEPAGRKMIEEYIAEVPFLGLVCTAENPVKAQQCLGRSEIDLIYLDIQMPVINGIDFLRELNHPAMIILTTAFSKYALQGFELDVIDYLLKPVSPERFLKASAKARDFMESRKAGNGKVDYFFIKCNNKFEKINCNELLFVEAANNYVMLQTMNKRFITYCTLKSMEDMLPSGDFIKVHKSFLVSISKIDNLDSEVVGIGAFTIPISRSLKDHVLQRVLNTRLIKRI